jgi:two-component system chemotaxis response regulator CheB
MQSIRVLIIDHSPLTRLFLEKKLAAVPEFEIVGLLADADVALALIPDLEPDLVVVHSDVPDPDVAELCAELGKRWPELPTLLLSSQTERARAASVEALLCGASDCVVTPYNVGNPAVGIESVAEELIGRAKALGRRGPRPPLSTRVPGFAPASSRLAPASSRTAPGAIDVVAIGAGAGGPLALSRLLSALPPDLPVPVLIVQHLPPRLTRPFAEALAARSRLRVVQAELGDRLEPGCAYVAPSSYHLQVSRRRGEALILLSQSAPENLRRPAVDALFESAARVFGPAALAVTLTGIGRDGLRGAALIRQAGGHVLAQDEPTSLVWDMPGYVVDAGLADDVLPLQQMAGEIERRIRPRRTPLELAAVS